MLEFGVRVPETAPKICNLRSNSKSNTQQKEKRNIYDKARRWLNATK